MDAGPQRFPGSHNNNININDTEDPHPSLSDFHDHEPNLEFDDTEISQTEIIALSDETLIAGENLFAEHLASTDDIRRLEAENYEDQLNMGEENESKIMDDIKSEKFIDFIGADQYGLHIFAIYACNLPAKREVDSSKIISLIINKMKEYVKNDYVLIYFHQGMRNESKPSAQFLWNSYKELDRSYKKNLKRLYVVHPTMFIRVVWNFFRPFISDKFKDKLVYVSSIDELKCLLKLNTLKLPQGILEFDAKLSRKTVVDGLKLKEDLPKTAQFGVPLKFVNENGLCQDYIPNIVQLCVSFLSVDEYIETEGIFRRSGHIGKINELKKRINAGDNIVIGEHDVFVISGLLKSFFRELSEPLLTFELYDEIIKFLEWPKDERPRNVKLMLREKLPIENYELFKYLVKFLVKVAERKDFNKMTSSNLAIVFAPNLVWAKHNQMSLDEIGPINAFLDFIIQNHNDIYMVDINMKETLD